MMKLAKYNNYNTSTQKITGVEKASFIFMEEANIPEDYTECHTIENLYNYGAIAAMDYQQIYGSIYVISSTIGFSELSNEEKAIVLELSAEQQSVIVAHYKSLGQTDVQAKESYSTKQAITVEKLSSVARLRVIHINLKNLLLAYLKDKTQIDVLISEARNAIFDYTMKFHLGTNYGQSTPGIMDIIENTDVYALSGGLNALQMSDEHKQEWYDANALIPGLPTPTEQLQAHAYVRDLLKNKLKDWLKDGISPY